MSILSHVVESNIQGFTEYTVGTSEVDITGTREVSSIVYYIFADTTNTGVISIGKSGVLNDGTNTLVRLNAGDELNFRYDDKSNALYAISDTANQKILVSKLGE